MPRPLFRPKTNNTCHQSQIHLVRHVPLKQFQKGPSSLSFFMLTAARTTTLIILHLQSEGFKRKANILKRPFLQYLYRMEQLRKRPRFTCLFDMASNREPKFLPPPQDNTARMATSPTFLLFILLSVLHVHILPT